VFAKCLQIKLKHNKRLLLPNRKSLYFGGERGIRTLGTLLTFTRFPVVRLRPAQPSLHKMILNLNRLNIVQQIIPLVNEISHKTDKLFLPNLLIHLRVCSNSLSIVFNLFTKHIIVLLNYL
jgi:hypothetical protein